MVKFTHRGIKEVIILECDQYSTIDDLISNLALVMKSGQPVILQWAEGVLFMPLPLPPETDNLMDEYLKGRMYWTSVVFALMPEYEHVVKKDNIEIAVLNATSSSILCQAAKWLKNRAKC